MQYQSLLFNYLTIVGCDFRWSVRLLWLAFMLRWESGPLFGYLPQYLDPVSSQPLPHDLLQVIIVPGPSIPSWPEAGPSIDSGSVVHVLWRTIIWPLDVDPVSYSWTDRVSHAIRYLIISRALAVLWPWFIWEKVAALIKSRFLISFHKLIAVSCFLRSIMNLKLISYV